MIRNAKEKVNKKFLIFEQLHKKLQIIVDINKKCSE
jgi:hypothetical protein